MALSAWTSSASGIFLYCTTRGRRHRLPRTSFFFLKPLHEAFANFYLCYFDTHALISRSYIFGRRLFSPQRHASSHADYRRQAT